MIKRQLLFVLEDIKNNFFHFCINFIQLTIGLLIFTFVIQTFMELNIIKEKMIHASKTEVYMLKDNTSDKKFDNVINGKKNLKKLRHLYEEVQMLLAENKEQADSYVADRTRQFYYGNGKQLKKIRKKHLADSSSKEISSNMLSVTPDFFEVFQLQGDFNGNVQQLLKKSKEQKIPVILGAKYKAVFCKNDVIQDSNGNQYKIAGFLKKHACYTAPDKTRKLIYLDDYIIKLNTIDKTDAVALCTYFNNLYIRTDNKEIPDYIVKRAAQLNLLDLETINFSYQMQHIIRDTNDEIFVNSTFMIMILLFVFVGITGSMLQFISNYKREFAIHMICGAQKKQIVMRIMTQIGMLMISSLLIVAAVFGLSKEFTDTIVFTIAFFMIVMIYPTILLFSQSIQMMIKRSYE